MAEEQKPGAAQTAAQTPAQAPAEPMQFQLQKLYVKDVSFEVPGAPEIYQDAGQADINMNLSQRVNEVTEDIAEVVLSITVTATSGDKNAYLVEVHQAGLFLIKGLSDQNRHTVMNTLCPHTLFPYASRVITDLVADGGFPPLVLQPLNFEQIYAQRMAEAQKAQAEGETPAANGETAPAQD